MSDWSPSEAWQVITNPNWFVKRPAEMQEAEEVYLREQAAIRELLHREGYLLATYHRDGTLSYTAVLTGREWVVRCRVCGEPEGICAVDCRLHPDWIIPHGGVSLNDFAIAVLGRAS